MSALWIQFFLCPVSHPSFLQWYFKKSDENPADVSTKKMFLMFFFFFFPWAFWENGRWLQRQIDIRGGRGRLDKKRSWCTLSFKALSLVFIKHVVLKELFFCLTSLILNFLPAVWSVSTLRINDKLPGLKSVTHFLGCLKRSLYGNKTKKNTFRLCKHQFLE